MQAVIIKDKSVVILGDPHMGRRFAAGVPLHRRGEREGMQRMDLFKSLHSAWGCSLHVNMGDIFDKPVVPFNVLLGTAELYRNAARANPNTRYVVIRGNHDASRDLEKRSAYDIFAALVADVGNLTVLQDEPVEIDGMAFVPWHPTKPAAEMVKELRKGNHTAFGHWDVDSFGQENPNLIPTQELAGLGIKTAYTGHVHKPHWLLRDGVHVVVVGSMQPYAHGEEVDDSLYVTIGLDELDNHDPAELRNKCVRVDIPYGRKLDRDIDCLQLTTRRLNDRGEPEDLQVDFGSDFDMGRLFNEAFEGVDPTIKGQVQARFNELRSQQ